MQNLQKKRKRYDRKRYKVIASDDEEDIEALQEDFSFENKSILDVEESENSDIDGEEITMAMTKMRTITISFLTLFYLLFFC